MVKHILIFLVGSLLLSCGQGEASSSKGGKLSPKTMATDASKAHAQAITALEQLLKTSDGDLVDEVDKLYEKHKATLLGYSKKVMSMTQEKYELYTDVYYEKAFSGLDSSFAFISHYRDSLIIADPGNILSAELQAYNQIAAYASPEMMKRLFPNEFEEIFGESK